MTIVLPWAKYALSLSLITCLSLASVIGHADTKQFIKAAKAGSVVDVQAMLDSGTPIDSADRKGRTALIWAAQRGHPDVADLLLREGADLKLADTRRRTALTWAQAKKHEGVVEVLRFYAALDANNVEGLEEFQQDYGGGRYAAQLPEKIQQARLAVAVSTDSVAGYQQYLAQYPDGAGTERVTSHMHTRWWADITAQKYPKIGELNEFLRFYPASVHREDALKLQRTVKERLKRTREDGRVRVAGPIRVTAKDLEQLLGRVNILIAPITLADLVLPTNQYTQELTPGASVSQMQFGGVVQNSVSIKYGRDRSKTFLSAHKATDAPPTNIGLWIGTAAQGGLASRFMGDVGKLMLRLHYPTEAAKPFGFSKVALFDAKHEYEYQFQNNGWVFNKLEREPDDA